MKGETAELLTGYADRWSAAAGESIDFMVSSDAPAVKTRLVRLFHGDHAPGAPGLVEEEIDSTLDGTIEAGIQVARIGSYALGPSDPEVRGAEAIRVTVSVWPTLDSPDAQTICSLGDPDGDGWALRLVERRVVLTVGIEGEECEIAGPQLDLRQWAHLDATIRPGEGWFGLAVGAGRGAGLEREFGTERRFPAGRWDGAWPFVLAGRVVAGSPAAPQIGEHFNGKVDSPAICTERPGASRDRAWNSGEAAPENALLAWDLSREPQSRRAIDVGPGGRDGEVVGAPARLMTGPRWDGRTQDPRLAPEQWSAIHFHEDDFEDAGWEPSVSWTVPEGTPSGIYALRLRAGNSEDHLPFVVRPRPGEPASDVGLLLPTFTYMAYANERMIAGVVGDHLVPGEDGAAVADAADLLLERHPEWGLSVYDEHRDGSGVCYSSRLRPIPNVRPGYRFWSTGGPERFGADLYITHFLRREGVEADVFTDEDLHREGRALLSSYRVILTGTHPEYWTEPMLDALRDYLQAGGRLMYLGGNGFYWVTDVDPDRPHLVEIRRGINGTRAWTSDPGEVHHSTSGEPGGLWRYRGRDPNKLVGVGFASQSDAHEPAAGYARLPDSHDPRVAFAFEGIGEDEIIGDFGLINGGAAGYEIDRTDPALGAPERVLRVATSQGRHGPTYMLVIEDAPFTRADMSGPECDEVRADLTFLSYPNGGAVFSVGSCNWCASLSHRDYDNNVARLTGNVLRAFRSDSLELG